MHRDASDAELVAAANSGDPEALAQLYLRHRDWTVALARRRVASDADALDVLQDAFLYLFGKFPGFRLDGSLRAFLHPVVRHLADRRRQRAQRAGPLPDEPVARRAPPPDPELAGALGALSEERREVVWLRFVDGFTLAEIAEVMEIPLGTVKSRLHGALRQLQQDPRARDFFLP